MAISPSTKPTNGDSKGWSEKISEATIVVFALLFGAGIASILSFNIVSRQQVSLELGQRAPETIEANRSITYISDVLTQEERERVEQEIFRYTPLDRNIGREQTNQAREIFRFVDVVRADQLADVEAKIRFVQAIEQLEIERAIAESLVTMPQIEYNAAKNETLSIVAEVMQQDIREDGINLAKDSVRRLISFELSPVQEQVVAAISSRFIVANVFFDDEATTVARVDAADAVEPIQQVITRGQPIIRVGDIVEARHLEALENLGLLQQNTNWFEVVSNGLVGLLAATALALYWWRFQRKTNRPRLYLTILAILLLIFLVLAKGISLIDGFPVIYFFPAAALAMLLTVIMDPRLAITAIMIVAAVVAFIFDSSLEIATYVAMGSIISVLTLRDTQRFYSFVRAGLFAAVGNLLVLFVFNIGADSEFSQLTLLTTAGLVNAVFLSPVLTIAGFFFVGLFGVTTVVQLQDLSRLDHPLLQELLRRAPGTYHHSIMVANLAEQAAERIGANSTLVRVGAFYHDIGKMNRPPFFTENQEGINPHDSLDPYSSARIILSHVTDGLEMARKFRLPQRIRDFIAEHHGDRVVKIFLERARDLAGDDAPSVDINRFRYAGPRPRSRETGIVLLADTIEAASSAVRPSSVSAIVKLVNSLVDDHLKEGQLDDSDLTMGDIREIRASFIETLKGRYHVRVRYPGNDRMLEDESPHEPVRN